MDLFGLFAFFRTFLDFYHDARTFRLKYTSILFYLKIALQLPDHPDPLDTFDGLNCEDLMVSNPAVAQPVKHVPTTTSTSNSASDMPSDISDLRSSDLLSGLSGVDIDRMFDEVCNFQ